MSDEAEQAADAREIIMNIAGVDLSRREVAMLSAGMHDPAMQLFYNLIVHERNGIAPASLGNDRATATDLAKASGAYQFASIVAGWPDAWSQALENAKKDA
jgi:hypothetical protein